MRALAYQDRTGRTRRARPGHDRDRCQDGCRPRSSTQRDAPSGWEPGSRRRHTSRCSTDSASASSGELRWRTEVPMPIQGDHRSADAVIDGQRIVAMVEAETRIDDVQALERRIGAKQRDLGIERVILLLADTRHNRAVVLNDPGHPGALSDRDSGMPLRTESRCGPWRRRPRVPLIGPRSEDAAMAERIAAIPRRVIGDRHGRGRGQSDEGIRLFSSTGTPANHPARELALKRIGIAVKRRMERERSIELCRAARPPRPRVAGGPAGAVPGSRISRPRCRASRAGDRPPRMDRGDAPRPRPGRPPS